MFRSREHIEDWCRKRQRDPGAILDLEQAWRSSRRWYAERRDDEWRRKRPADAQKVLTEIGLTGDFWKLH
jgi:hypothetical protein